MIVPEKLIFIQILRGISIFLVLLAHLSLPNALMEKLPLKLTNPGYIGVELFFVISGFVVTRSLQKNNFNFPKFICSRIFRLYPALFLFIALAWLVRGLTNFVGDNVFIKKLFGGEIENYAAQSFGVLTGTFINITNSASYSFGAMWSLSVEFQFYAIVAMLLMGFQYMPKYSLFVPRIVLFVSAAVVLSVINYRLFHWNEPSLFIQYLASGKFEFIAAGVMIAYLPTQVVNKLCATYQTKVCYGLLLLSLIWAAIHKSPLGKKDPTWLLNLEQSGYLGLLFLLALLVISGSNVGTDKIKNSPFKFVMLWFGDRSYSIYLLHFPCLAILWFILSKINGNLVGNPFVYNIIQFICGISIVAITSDACFRKIELPGIELGERVRQNLKKQNP